MDLLEYQAKEWFREMGIPVLPSQRIDRPSDLKGLKIPYPVVLKSQVRSGRGRAGGVKFVENTIDAIAAAQTFFTADPREFPEVLLAEAKYNADREFTRDRFRCRCPTTGALGLRGYRCGIGFRASASCS